MTSDFDVSQYMGLFLDEAEEQLQILDESIIVLEHDKENMDLLNKIFRAAHTLKGSSASMGFDNIARPDPCHGKCFRSRGIEWLLLLR